MRSNKTGIIMIVIGILLLGGFWGYRVYAGSFKKISSGNISTALSDVDYSIVYLGELDDKKESLLKETIKDTRIEVYT
ncbi:MAG: hypothetical protein K2G03_04055, partial [Bacilli bacterium]|nr:hypothetical protein [Bacilli bacterium]